MTEDLVIHKIFSNAVSRFPEKIALEIKQANLWQGFTYKEIETLALKVGAFLLGQGFESQDFIGLILENRPEWPIIYLGIMYAGMTCVPIDTQLTSEDLENIINDCGAKIIFTSYNIFTQKINEKIRQSLKKIVILGLDLDKEQEPLINFSQIKDVSIENISWPVASPDDIASLIYTSGTTAKPKGVILTHRNFCSNFKSIEKLNLCFPSDSFLSILPLHHTYPFMITLLVPLGIGATVAYCASFNPQDLTNIIKEAKVTILVGVPQLFSLLHKAIFDRIKKIPFVFRPLVMPFIKAKIRNSFGNSLRLLVSGGARLSPQIPKDLFKVGFKIVEGYGLTETSPVVALNPPRKIKFGSVGKPIPEVEIRIHHPDKSGIGEVLIKGPNVMQGYLRQPDLTAKVIENNWFHSGDLGYIDKEGYLFLTGREKDVIVLSSGKNIYPEELEEIFLSRSPYIKEMCVLSVAEKKFGKDKDIESLYAVIVPNLEYFRKKNEINIREKIIWEIENISKKLPSYQHIMGFAIAKEELPKTQLKKIKRYQIREKYLKEKVSLGTAKEATLSEDDAKIVNTDLAQKVINYLTKELKKHVYLNSHLEIDLGIDSLSRVELGLGLEALLRLKIPSDLIEKVFTVRELIVNLQQAILQVGERGRVQFKEEKRTWDEIIKQIPSDEILNKIKITSGFLDRLLTFIFKSSFCFIFRVFWLLKIEGREGIPKNTPYIFCSNHASYLDGFVLFSSIPFHSAINLFFLGHAKIFEHPLVAWTIKIARLISIDPATHLTEAMQASSFVLSHKKVICIFPEGSRSISEEVGEFKKGIGILAKELDIPIIPVYIKGSHYSWPRGSRFPRPCPLKIIFGKPLDWHVLGNDYESITRALREEVSKLKD